MFTIMLSFVVLFHGTIIVDGLVAREFQRFYSGGDDAATDVVRKALHKAKDRKDVCQPS